MSKGLDGFAADISSRSPATACGLPVHRKVAQTVVSLRLPVLHGWRIAGPGGGGDAGLAGADAGARGYPHGASSKLLPLRGRVRA